MPITTRVDVLEAADSPVRTTLRLAWPVALSMSFHTSYSLVDMFWVSSLGTEPVAAVTLSGLIFWLGFAVSQVFAGGAHALIARAYGAENYEKVGHITREALGAAAVAGVFVACLAGFGAQAWLRILGATRAVAQVGGPYVQVMAVGFLASIALFTLGSVFRATGDMVTPLILSGISCGLNMVLDPIFIFGLGPVPAFGLPGAALASVLSIFAALIWGLSLVLRPSSNLRLPLRLKPDTAALRDLFAVGVPSGCHYVLLSLTQMAMIRMTAFFGTHEVAAAGIGSRIAQLSFLPCMGIGAATATIVGQTLGARQPQIAERAVAVALRLNLAVTAVIGLLYACCPRVLLSAFTAEPAVLRLGSVFLRLNAVAFLFVTATIVLTRVFQGAGDTVWPTLVVGLRFITFLPTAYALAWLSGMDAYGVWSAMAVCSALQTIVIAWVYRKGTWKRRRLASVESTPSGS